jgi:hypothetical protein
MRYLTSQRPWTSLSAGIAVEIDPCGPHMLPSGGPYVALPFIKEVGVPFVAAFCVHEWMYTHIHTCIRTYIRTCTLAHTKKNKKHAYVHARAKVPREKRNQHIVGQSGDKADDNRSRPIPTRGHMSSYASILPWDQPHSALHTRRLEHCRATYMTRHGCNLVDTSPGSKDLCFPSSAC